jgi:selenide,water dikinase
VVGLVDPGKQITNAGARPGDRLVLTKPLGTGIVTTAGKQGVAAPEVIHRAVSIMSTLNRAASEAMVKVGVNASTDVTGFGLIGHLKGMVQGSGVGARLRLSRIPVIPGVWELIEDGVAPGGTHRNLNGVGKDVQWDEAIRGEARLLLCDAQTSGGLLISVPEERTDLLLKEIADAGVEGAVVIGDVVADDKKGIQVSP